MKKSLKLSIVGFFAATLAGSLTGISVSGTESQAADGCSAGYTKNAVKSAGTTAYASRCKLAACKPIGSVAYSSAPDFSRPPFFTVYYVYTATSGSAPTNTCRSEVSNDTWE